MILIAVLCVSMWLVKPSIGRAVVPKLKPLAKSTLFSGYAKTPNAFSVRSRISTNPQAPRKTALFRAVTDETLPVNPAAVVVGGGPAGLATAIMLANRGWDVKLLEQKENVSFEISKAYLYLIDARGQKFTNKYGLTEGLMLRGVNSLNYTIARVFPDKRGMELLKLFSEKAESYANIEMIYGSELRSIDRVGDKVRVRAGKFEKAREFYPDLIVGADGLNSEVRKVCSQWSSDPTSFDPVQMASPSTGLQYKMIKLPPKFPLGRGEKVKYSEGTQAYAIYSNVKDSKRRGKLGLLPVAQEDAPRTANVIQKDDHMVWKLNDGGEVLEWLEENFPHIPVRDIVSEEEADAFAKEREGRFPAPQYSPRCQVSCGDGVRGTCVLVGDSLHAFPPDLGQGVNAALEDICDLEDAFSIESGGAAGDSPDIIKNAATRYEEIRAPEAKSLVQIMQVGWPYQYGQDRFREKFWMINFVLRTFILNKILPFLFNPAAVIMLQDSRLRYSEVWRRAQQTTRRLIACLAASSIFLYLRLVSGVL